MQSANDHAQTVQHAELPYVIQDKNMLFPHALGAIVLPDSNFKSSIDRALAGDRRIAVLFEMPPFDEAEEVIRNVNFDPNPWVMKANGKIVLTIGLVARIVKTLRMPDGSLRVLCRGLYRAKVNDFRRVSPTVLLADLTEYTDDNTDSEILPGLIRSAKTQFTEIAGFAPSISEEARIALFNESDAGRIADMITDLLPLAYIEKLISYSKNRNTERLKFLLILMNRELETIHLGAKIQSNVQNEMSRAQREFFLREQLRQITMELGEETSNPDIIQLKDRLRHKKIPNAVREIVYKEIERMNMIPPASAEYNISFTYVDWILTVPWGDYSKDKVDVKEAAKILDRDHFGLEDVKERILEFLSVLQVRKNCKSPIICFVGPPGVGKTSLGKSIAESLGRKFVRMSLGGIKDEAEIRGHRRTYIGALPGRIIQGMKKAGTSNPVFMLDELDKVGSDYRGDPSSALLEVLDPEQNVSFNDHYLEVDYDLSRVMFIATANVTDTIPKPLLDRMEVIRLPGYTIPEKEQIAKRYLVPRQMKENGLTNEMAQFTRSAIMTLVRCYTMESGVRNLERQIASVCRKAVRYHLENQPEDGSKQEKLLINSDRVKQLLGAEMILPDVMIDTPRVGVAIGMAWTSCGGSTLEIEAVMVPGKGNLKLTGSLGDVMKESAQAAFTFVHSHADVYGIANDVFDTHDFHIHVPDGATPKDGPSAGVTLSTALYSLLTGKPTQPRLSMTGEITLHGRVTAVGGIREKVIAALTNGITDIIMPASNQKDLQDVPEEMKSQINFHFVTEIDEVFKLAVPDVLRPTAPKDIQEEEALYSYDDDIFKEELQKKKPVSIEESDFSSIAFQVEGQPGMAPDQPAKTIPEAMQRTMEMLDREEKALKKKKKAKTQSKNAHKDSAPESPAKNTDSVTKSGSTFVLANQQPLSAPVVSTNESDHSEQNAQKQPAEEKQPETPATSSEDAAPKKKRGRKSKNALPGQSENAENKAVPSENTEPEKKPVVKRVRKPKKTVSQDDDSSKKASETGKNKSDKKHK